MSRHHAIDYVELTVTDLAAARAFYGSVFGWGFQEWGSSYLAFEGAGLDGGITLSDTPAPRCGALVIVYSERLDDTRAAVVAAGGEITAEHVFPGGRRFHFLDPSGNELAVWTKVA